MLMYPPHQAQHGQNGQRNPHRRRRFVRLAVTMAVIVMPWPCRLPAWLAEEGQEERAEHVEGGHAGGEDAHPVHPGRVFIGRRENRVLAVIARRTGERRRSPRSRRAASRT